LLRRWWGKFFGDEMALEVGMNADMFLGLMIRGGMLGIVLGCLRGLGRILGMGGDGGWVRVVPR